ncbi:MAG TPA: hypothetical protein VHL11_14725, partial [Phototrophicaceae bacterium]|nr:hypothetical protein [Phototrophicaceae bacterium]
MFHRSFPLLTIILFFTSVIAAQEAPPLWCPLPETETTATEDQLTPTPALNFDDSTALLTDADISNTADIQFSSDGQWVAFAHVADDKLTSLWIAHPDGSEAHELISSDQLSTMRHEDFDGITGIYNFDWLSGQHIIVFNTRVYPTNEGIFIPIADDLWTVDADTGEVMNRLPQGNGGEFEIAPDGQTIAIMQEDQVDLLTVEDYSVRRDILPDYRAIGFGEV